jgi:hypothetical protein
MHVDWRADCQAAIVGIRSGLRPSSAAAPLVLISLIRTQPLPSLPHELVIPTILCLSVGDFTSIYSLISHTVRAQLMNFNTFLHPSFPSFKGLDVYV